MRFIKRIQVLSDYSNTDIGERIQKHTDEDILFIFLNTFS